MRILTTSLLSIVILGAGVGGYLLFGKPPKVAQNEDLSDFRPLVRTVPLEKHSQPVVIEMDGNANSFRVITVGTQVKGQIRSRSDNARNGMFVKEGDLLFEIDPTNYQLDLDRLEAQQSQTQEEIRSVEVDILNTAELISLSDQEWRLQKKQYERLQALLGKAASESDVDAAARQELASRNALQTLKNSKRSQQQLLRQKEASLKLVAAQLQQARVNLERCQVRAPVGGRVVDDLAEQGDFVREGQELVHISDSSKIDVTCNLEVAELSWILQHVAGAAEVVEQALSEPLAKPIPCEVVYSYQETEVVWDGLLSRFEGTGMDRDTRTFPCRVTVNEPTNYRIGDSQGGRLLIAPPLSSGMFVTVRVPVSATDTLMRLPVEAVRPGGVIWLVRDDTLHLRRVSVAHSTDEEILVRATDADLQDTDHVIVSPLVAAKDGMRVRVESGE